MTAQILDGKAVAKQRRLQLKQQIQQLSDAQVPGLTVILVGDNPASQVYVNHKIKACAEVGIHSEVQRLPTEITQAELLERIDSLNANPVIHGILVQLPLPEHIDTDAILQQVNPDKDVDGFHPVNMGRLALRLPGLRPCTPKGIMTLLQQADIALEGLDAVIIGQSNIVGRPMALELLAARCTVTICHSRTKDLVSQLQRADLVVAAVGRANFVQAEWIREGAIVIDVGTNRQANGKLCGDVDFAAASQKAAWITPSPGGVGPMTIASLLENTLQAAQTIRKIQSSA